MDKYLIATKLRKYFEKTKDKVLTISNIRRHFGCYEFSDNLPIVHTADIRPIGLIVKLFHNLILYLLFIFVCLLPKLTPENTRGLMT